MAIRIRLAKMGRKNHPIYRIVVMDSKSPREGEYIDIIGTYDPKNKKVLEIKPERVKEWINKGAEITDRAKAILKIAKVL